MSNFCIVLAAAFSLSSAPSLAQVTLTAENANWIVYGEQGTAHFGYHVASAGDIDGDGYDDVLIGDTMRVTFHRGSASGPEPGHAWTLDGQSIAIPAGDVNGDGYDDILVGPEGSLVLYLGSPAGPAPSSSTISGFTPRTGDFNGDGFADLAVTVQSLTIHVFHGSATGFPEAPSMLLTMPSNEEFIQHPPAVEDVNGDGYDDYALTSGRARRGGNLGFDSWLQQFEVSVFLGSPDGLANRRNGFNQKAPLQVVSVGDVNADGFGDLALGRHGEPGIFQHYWVPGDVSGLNTQSVFKKPYFKLSCCALEGMGDFTGDGFADVYDPDGAELHAGGALGLSQIPFAILRVGRLFAPAGDVNGDGLADIIVGDRLFDNGLNRGRVLLFLGRPMPAPPGAL